MKLLILLLLGYFCWRALKNWVLSGSQTQENVSSAHRDAIDDIMVKDPVCGVYFPKRDGIGLTYKGEELYFCSQECKAKFLHTHNET